MQALLFEPYDQSDEDFSKPSLPSRSIATSFAMDVIQQGDVLKELKKIKKNSLFDVVIADPPYNIGKDFGNNQDSRDLQEYCHWSKEWIKECFRLVKPSGLIYVYGFAEILAHIAVSFPIDQQRWLAWHYTNKAVPSSKFWQRSHESILCLWKGQRPKINIDAIREPYTESYKKCAGKVRRETKCRYNGQGKETIYNAHPKGALPRDVIKAPALAGGAGHAERWFLCRDCGGVYEPRELKNHQNCDVLKHPTQKPSLLTEKLILSAAKKKNGKLLVPFAGSGSECVVAKKLKVGYYGIEINPEYVNLAREWLARV